MDLHRRWTNFGQPIEVAVSGDWGSVLAIFSFRKPHTSSALSNGLTFSMKSCHDIQLSNPFGPSVQRAASDKSVFTTEF